MRVQNEGSHTAKIACFSRAMAFAETGVGDNLAYKFLSPRSRGRLGTAESRQKILDSELPPHQYSYFAARTLFMDSVFTQAIADGFQQYVILGAGFDSRAYRFELPTDAVVYEIDAPTTQAQKKEYLTGAEIAVPDHVRFVPVDFMRETIGERLLATGYDATLKTLFIWEGVTYYISEQAVLDTLAFVREQSAVGSRLAFDYLYEAILHGETDYLGANFAVKYVAEAGEPFIFGIKDGRIQRFLNDAGFTMVAHYDAEQMHDAFLDDRFRPMYGYMANVLVETPPT